MAERLEAKMDDKQEEMKYQMVSLVSRIEDNNESSRSFEILSSPAWMPIREG
jgi:hypothetical protein